MAEPLKNFYSDVFFDFFYESFFKVTKVKRTDFDLALYQRGWDALELMQRSTRIMECMKQFLSQDYPKAIQQILELIDLLEAKKEESQAYWYIFLAEYVQKNGLAHWKVSMQAMERITQFVSCEFAIRPFIQKYPGKTMDQLLIWTKHDNEHVRRLASEGCRPRLPWATALPEFKKDPTEVLKILKPLMQDEALYVRRSVANNFNDISKDHPQIILQIVKESIGQNKDTDWILKHASRTLLKAGDLQMMKYFGYADAKHMEVTLTELQDKVAIGSSLNFQFSLKNTSEDQQKVRLEYAIFYKRKSGFSKKVFKISEKEMSARESITIEKKQSFRIINTRTFYKGIQGFVLIINGVEFEKREFELI